MEGRYPIGLLVTRTNCTDSSKTDEFNRWYNHMHLPDVTAPRIFHHAIRFANTDPSSSAGQYIATYETDIDDVSKARPAHREAIAKLGGQEDRGTPLIQSVSTGIFKRLGGQFVASIRPTRGILLVLTNCEETAREEEFNRWYEDVHIPDILDTGAFHAAYRYESPEPEDAHARYLAIYETDNPDPAKAREEITKFIPDWQKRGRMFDGMDLVALISARRIWPMA